MIGLPTKCFASERQQQLVVKLSMNKKNSVGTNPTQCGATNRILLMKLTKLLNSIEPENNNLNQGLIFNVYHLLILWLEIRRRRK